MDFQPTTGDQAIKILVLCYQLHVRQGLTKGKAWRWSARKMVRVKMLYTLRGRVSSTLPPHHLRAGA
jgi:hypothetical protein